MQFSKAKDVTYHAEQQRHITPVFNIQVEFLRQSKKHDEVDRGSVGENLEELGSECPYRSSP